MNVLTQEDYDRGGAALGVPSRTVEAICKVEAPGGGFDNEGRVRILFEAHKFGQFTGHKFDFSHPSISAPNWAEGKKYYSKGANADIRNEREWVRLEEAMNLDRAAAIKSASWGKFQIMGFNHEAAGFNTPEEFFQAMHLGEGAQLDAFLNYVRQDRGGAILRSIRSRNAQEFARLYNGEGYAANAYDTKLMAEGF